MRRAFAAIGALLGLVLALLAPASAAQAHDVGGVGATNFHTTLSAVTPAVDGISVSVIENGSRLELRNATATDVVIAGYGGEPYARIGPGGAFLNDNSPATYLNASRYSSTSVPAGVDPTKRPAWRQVDTAPVLRWHDHRIHWMLSTLPPIVAADLGAPHRVTSWTINLTYGATPLTVTGTLEWLPGPDPWPWFVLAALVVLGLGLVPLLARPHRVLAAAGLGAVAIGMAHGVGVMIVQTGTAAQKLGALFGEDALLIWPFAIAGGLLLWLRHTRALWIAAAAGLVMAVTLIIDDAPVWWRSSAPTALSLGLDRLSVAIVVGIGLGLVAALPTMLRRHAPPARPWTKPAGWTVPRDVLDGTAVEPAPGGQSAPEPSPVTAAAGGVSMNRRQVAGALAAGAFGALAGAAAGAAIADGQPSAPAPVGPGIADVGRRTIGFFGAHQAGIVTPAKPQSRAWVAAFDVAPGADRAALVGLLTRWSAAAEALMAGRGLGHTDDAVVAGLGPAALTVTVGFGPSLFGRALPASARPEALAPLPAFTGERLDPAHSDGDLGVVVAGDDPVVVAHAARVLRRLASPTASVRWQQSAFSAARGNAPDASTGRNLMGQVDGSNNPKPADPDFEGRVFATGPGFMIGGSYLVVRRIRMLLDDWDRVPLADQERVIGRRKDSGAPLSGGAEFTAADYGARTSDGVMVIPAEAHIRLATPAFNDGAAMLRRGFSYVDGEAAGLLFLAWQADPRRGFIPVQRRLAAGDALGRFIRHETSALFAMPAGVAPGGYLGQSLLEG